MGQAFSHHTGGLAPIRYVLAFRFEIVDVELQHVLVFDGVRDCVRVQFALKQVIACLEGSFVFFAVGLDRLLLRGVLFKDRRTGERESIKHSMNATRWLALFPQRVVK